MKRVLLIMMLVVGVCFTISASIKPSTVENPIWYQLQSGNEYLGWYDYGAIYTKLEGVTLESIDDTDKLEWAFIPTDEGYRLLNKANSQFMGVREGYVNLSDEGIVWTVDEFEDEGYITFSCSDGALYSSYFVQVGNRTPAHFTPIEVVSPIPTSIFASIKPSTVENPIWYQLQSGNEYLGWYDYGVIYTKLEGVTLESIDDVDKLEWAFIPSDEGYRLLNKANSQFMGVVENYVNLSEEGIVWTVDEFMEDGYITFSCSDGALYSSYFVQVGNRTPAHFTPIEMVPPIPTALNAVSYSSVDEVYDLQGRRIGSQVKNLPAGIYMVNGRKVVVR